jgi:hypothetical protein
MWRSDDRPTVLKTIPNQPLLDRASLTLWSGAPQPLRYNFVPSIRSRRRSTESNTWRQMPTQQQQFIATARTGGDTMTPSSSSSSSLLQQRRPFQSLHVNSESLAQRTPHKVSRGN